jgi:hypothetical protein
VNAILYWLLIAGHRKAIEARRAGRRSAFVAWSAAAALSAALAAVLVLGLGALFMHVGWWWAAIPIVAGAGLPVFAGPLAEHVAVPLGAARLAAFLGKRALGAGSDPDAVALVWAARAVAVKPTPRALAWVLAARDRRGRIGDAEVVATGLCIAAGDLAGARALIESAGELAEVHPAVRELAGEWLAADDAERGAWARIAARAASPARWPASPTTFLLEGVAARLTGAAGAPGRASLIAAWIEAPRRGAAWPLVRRALAADPRPRTAEPDAPAPADVVRDAEASPAAPAGALHAALAAHVALARRGADTPAAEVAAVAAAWDRALADPDTRIAVLSRAAALGAPADAGDRVLRDLAAAAAGDLAELAERAGIGLDGLADAATAPGGSPTLAAAAGRVRHRLLGDLELAFARLGDRCADRAALPAIDEWRALCALRAAYDCAAEAGGLELRRLAFVHAHVAVGRLAVWLWNDRGEHVLSHAMSAWLAAEAHEVGDAQAQETHGHNARLRLPARPARR